MPSTHRDGWTLLHASAVARHGRAVLTFGNKGVGVPEVPAACVERCRSVTEADFLSTKTEDRHPDIFGLASTDSTTRDHARAIARDRFAYLPRYAVTLGHNIHRQHRPA